jgi:hypothetical protein
MVNYILYIFTIEFTSYHYSISENNVWRFKMQDRIKIHQSLSIIHRKMSESSMHLLRAGTMQATQGIWLSFPFVCIPCKLVCPGSLKNNLSIMWMVIVVMVCHNCLLQICSNGLWNCFDIVVWAVFDVKWNYWQYRENIEIMLLPCHKCFNVRFVFTPSCL